MKNVKKAYSKWLASCLKKYNKKFGESRKYTEQSDDHPHDEVVEFDEDGNAYTYSIKNGVKEFPKVVTPWMESKYYLEGM